MNNATLPEWGQLSAEALHRLEELGRHVRQWAAAEHAATRSRTIPGRVVAALNATNAPPRVRLVALRDPTARDFATAAADDLWDAVAAVWAMVNHSPAGRAGLHHVVAELQTAGVWLASFPVHAARHELALAALFEPVEVVA